MKAIFFIAYLIVLLFLKIFIGFEDTMIIATALILASLTRW